MKTIFTAIAIALAAITAANAQNTEAHCFKAEELEIEAEVLEDEIEVIIKQLVTVIIAKQEVREKLADSVGVESRTEAALLDEIMSNFANSPAYIEITEKRTEVEKLQARALAHRLKAGGCKGNYLLPQ